MIILRHTATALLLTSTASLLSLGYKVTPSISIHFDANNLNDPIRHHYYLTENAPGYWH